MIIAKKFRRAILRILLIFIVTLLFVDFMLYHLDPLGVVAARHAQATLFFVMESHPSGYRLKTGQHKMHNYFMTITEDGYRRVPDSAKTDCVIAAIGDSVTMGIGVNDAETWVNLLAQMTPQVTWYNTGRSDYSAGNILSLLQNTPADGYIWLIIGNDAITPFNEIPVLLMNINIYLPATRLYLEYIRSRYFSPPNPSMISGGQVGRSVDYDQYWQYADQILTHPSVLSFGFEDGNLERETALRYENVQLIPTYTEVVSPTDGHPNAAGHRQIADAMLPYVQKMVERVCS